MYLKLTQPRTIIDSFRIFHILLKYRQWYNKKPTPSLDDYLIHSQNSRRGEN